MFLKRFPKSFKKHVLTWQLLAGYTGSSYDLSLTGLNEWNRVDWQPVTLNLAGAPANSTAARLRFNLVVDAEGSDKGWIIDDVVVETCPNLDCLSPPLEKTNCSLTLT